MSINGLYNIYGYEDSWTIDLTFHKNDGSGIQETITQTYGQPYIFPAWDNIESINWVRADGPYEFGELVLDVLYSDVYIVDDSDKTITFDSLGGSPVSDIVTEFNTNISYSQFEIPTRAGYVFLGWYKSEGFLRAL